jgi:hypothetical protein
MCEATKGRWEMCYTIPVAGALVTSLVWRKTKSIKIWWLNLLFLGGALFGVVDHLWNGELFLVSPNAGRDLILGIIIAFVIFLFWIGVLFLAKVNPTLTKYLISENR